MKIGDLYKFDGEVQRYRVQAFNANYIVLTKPFNARKTYLYRVVDVLLCVSGHFGRWGPPVNLDNPAGAQEVIRMLQDGLAYTPHKFDVKLTDNEVRRLFCSPAST